MKEKQKQKLSMFKEVLRVYLSCFGAWYLSNICLELMVQAHICKLVCMPVCREASGMSLVAGSLTVTELVR